MTVPTPTLADQLRERLHAAIARADTAGDPQFGVVEVTIRELAALLEYARPDRALDAVATATTGHACHTARTIGHRCDLADRLVDLLGPDRHIE